MLDVSTVMVELSLTVAYVRYFYHKDKPGKTQFNILTPLLVLSLLYICQLYSTTLQCLHWVGLLQGDIWVDHQE